MNYNEHKSKLEGYDIQHHLIDPQSVELGEDFTTEVIYKRKTYEVTIPTLKFLTDTGDWIEVRPHSYGVPTISWLFNDSKYAGGTERVNYAWGEYSMLCNSAYDPNNQGFVNETVQALSNLIFVASYEADVYEMWLHTFRGNVAGFTRTYNTEVTEHEILDSIFEAGFGEKLVMTYPIYKSNEKNVNFSIRLDGLSRVSLMIRNGYNGDSALSYHIGVYNKEGNEPIHISKPISRNLHRGKLSDTFNNLIQQLSEVKTQEVLNRVERNMGVDFMLKLHTITADVLPNVQSLKLKRGDSRAPLKKIPTSDKAMGRIHDTFSSVFSDVKGKTGLELIDELRIAGRINKCSTSIEILINYLFTEELITDDFLKELQGE